MKRWLVVATIGGLFVLTMLAASLQGAPAFDPPRIGEFDRPVFEQPAGPLEPEPYPTGLLDAAGDQGAGPMIALAVTAVIAFALLALFVRLLIVLWRTRRLRRRRGAAVGAALAEPVADDEAALAPAVRQGIVEALTRIDRHADPSDAIVAAWVGLEESASGAGIVRGVSETPAEFTVRVVARTDSVATEARTLLALYERVRFGGVRATEVERATARSALDVIEREWR